MSNTLRPAGIGALILVGLLAGHEVARAQFGNPYANNPFANNPQFQYNLQLGRAALANSMVNPSTAYAVPYPTPAYNPFSAYGTNPYLPATPGAAAAGSNPYTPSAGAYDPYSTNPYVSPYLYNNPAAGPGLFLMGGADVMRAYGTVITKQEEARIMREQWKREKLKTEKDAFDLRMYIRNNTPTWTEEQTKVAKHTLVRLQKFSTPSEIVEGRSLNYLLKDVDQNRGKATVTEIPLGSEVLRHLNVKPSGQDTYSLGILRDKITLPSALLDLMPAEDRQKLEERASALSKAALVGKEADRAMLKDFKLQIADTLDKLIKKANTFGTPEYMEAKRFLADLENARVAIDRGSANVQVAYQQMVSKNEIETVNQLIKTMIDRGWQFAPATQADEAAYRALHSALVQYDVALNQQAEAGTPPSSGN